MQETNLVRKKGTSVYEEIIPDKMTQNLEDRNTATVVSETAVFSLVMILSLVGNLLVCFAVYRNPRLRCPSNYYIISLALSDILQALCTMPLSVVFLATGRWPFGTYLCYFSAITKFSLAKISIYTMVLMAINRYYKIVKPAKYQSTFKKRFIVATASLVWVIFIIYSTIAAFVRSSGAKEDQSFALCLIHYHISAIPILTLLMYLPYFPIVFCYWKIYRAVKVHNANVSWQSSNVEDVTVSKTLCATVVCFVSLWMPANCIYLSSVFLKSTLPRELALLSSLLIFSSSCVNPFIYGFMNRAFKKEFKKYLVMRKTHSIDAESSSKRKVFLVNSKTVQS